MEEKMREYYEWFLTNSLPGRIGIVIGVIAAVVLILFILLCLFVCVEHFRAFIIGGCSVCLVGGLIYGIYKMVQDDCFYKEFLIGAGVMAVLLWLIIFIASVAEETVLDFSFVIEQMAGGTYIFFIDLFSLGLICTIVAIPFIAFGWKSQD